MKKFKNKYNYIFIFILILLTGCNSTSGLVENFSNENYNNFPDTANIIYDLDLNEDDVIILEQEINKLVFGFLDSNLKTNYENVSSYSTYIKTLEEQGYVLTSVDKIGNKENLIFKVVTLENDNNHVSITEILDLKHFKKAKKNNTKNIRKLNNQNILFEIIVKP